MGQQQLLLIVLGVIIVGVAIIAGIGLFNAGAEEAVKDELTAQCLALGANAQQFYKKPVAMGGGGNTFTGNGGWTIPDRMLATANAGTIDPSTGIGTATANGGYARTNAAQTVTIVGTPNLALGYEWTVECTVTPTNITTEIVPN